MTISIYLRSCFKMILESLQQAPNFGSYQVDAVLSTLHAHESASKLAVD